MPIAGLKDLDPLPTPEILPPIRVVLGPGGTLESATGPGGGPLPPHVIGQIMEAMARSGGRPGYIGNIVWRPGLPFRR
jgi:hypothetical protein